MKMARAILLAVALSCIVPTPQGMEFEYQANGGNCRACDWVLAEGTLDKGTTDKLKAFIAHNEYQTKNIRFNSPGGDLIEALKLGEVLREDKWDTFVGEEYPSRTSTPAGYVTQQSNCYSACVYAFAGGVRRTADDKSLGVHQFYRPDDAVRPTDKTLSAVDVANMQHLAAMLNEYVRGMGIDPRLVSMASEITPWNPSAYLVAPNSSLSIWTILRLRPMRLPPIGVYSRLETALWRFLRRPRMVQAV